ncbi:MAG: YaiI/YqxD family protein [Nitrospirae bacterium]|nr:YaiI/YqxD family protein [Nitrospirota bacterium]MBI5096760.1 YaiI/YqxD family protein [Nitrospirota bacterium]
MQIFVDADACPVREIIYKEAQTRGVHVTMVVSMAHEIRAQEGMDVLRVDSAFQAVDIAIINRAASGDIVVTSDFGLASISLGKGAKVISPSGRIYSEQSIDTLLEKRHAAARQRRGGGRVKGPKARKRVDDETFRENLIRLIEGGIR